MRYYPLSIDTKDKNALVVGGGRAAYLKLKNLTATSALITVVSKEFCSDILNLQKLYNEKLILIEKEINKDKIDFADEYIMVFICTDNRDLNNELFKYFKNKKTLIMISDDKENSDFITSAVLTRENITIAFNSEGNSPTAAKLLLMETEKILTDEFIKKINLICKIRKLLINEKYTKLNGKETGYIMDSLALYSNQDLEDKLRVLNELTGESK